MDLFSELDAAPQDAALSAPARQTKPRMSRAQREALSAKRARQRAILEDARANGVIVEREEQLRCSAPCPTVLGYPHEVDGMCPGCRLALARAGIVVEAAG